MAPSIFYSWQTDSPDLCNRRFIREALDGAVAQLGEGSVEDAPRVDSGMEGISGSPEVATVMFEKIQESSIFVGDMTLVGSITGHSGEVKRVPNPNVLLEMGYAAGVAGWGRVICVMNEHFGTRKELPFDVRNRRFPIDYDFDPRIPKAKDKLREDLTKWLKIAIEAVLKNENQRVEKLIARLDVNCLNLIGANGGKDWFAAPDPGKFSIGGTMDTPRFGSAVIRLLDLQILKSDVAPEKGLYAYHWTPIGKEVLRKLGVRR